MQSLRQRLRFLAAVQLLPALESGEETLVGGQAVLEGVMMRSPHAWGICIRRPDGTLATHSEPLERPSEKHKWMGWPVIRGVMTLGQAMALGFRALRYSANVAMGGLTAEDEKKTEVSSWALALNVVLSVGFFIFMYKFVPLLAATKLKNAYPAFGNQIAFNMVDGVIRIALFLLFIWGISRLPDIRRVFQYHGAEHKTVFAFESRDPLTVRERAVVFDVSSPLRHQLPDDGDADRDGDLHDGAGDNVLGAVRLPHRAVAGDRGRVVRDDSLCRQARLVVVRGAYQAGTLAAADHHAASRG